MDLDIAQALRQTVMDECIIFVRECLDWLALSSELNMYYYTAGLSKKPWQILGICKFLRSIFEITLCFSYEPDVESATAWRLLLPLDEQADRK